MDEPTSRPQPFEEAPIEPPPGGAPPFDDAGRPERYPIPLDRLANPPPPPVLELLRALPARFPATFGIAAVTTLVFVVQCFVGLGPEGLLRLGAVRGDRVFEHGEWFRLLCGVLLHGHWIHILLNEFAFLQVGLLVESRWGSWRLLAAYGVCGLASSLMSATLLRGTAVVGSVGASGAIMGLAGLLLAAQAIAHDPVRSELNRMIGRRLLFGVLLTFGLGTGVNLFWPIIDNWGHLGGFLAGLALCGLWRQPLEPSRLPTRVVGVAVVLGFAASIGGTVLRGQDAVVDLPRFLGEQARAALTRPDAPADEALRALAQLNEVAANPADREELEALVDGLVTRDALEVWARGSDDVGLIGAACNLLLVLQHPDADVLAERLLELAPQDPNALNVVAWTLVVGPPERRDPQRALELSRESLASLPQAPLDSIRMARAAYLDTQAEALFQLGRADEALTLEREAVELGRQVGIGELADMEARLARIEAAVAAERPAD